MWPWLLLLGIVAAMVLVIGLLIWGIWVTIISQNE